MECSLKFKLFLKENRDAINLEKWDALFEAYKYSGCPEYPSILTRLLMSIDLDPLKTLKEVPNRYLYDDPDICQLILRDNPFLEKVGQFAFAECINLDYVEFAEGLTHIDVGAFCGCKNIQELYLPSTLKRINYNAFYSCTNLREIHFGGTIREWLSVEQSKSEVLWNNVPARKTKCIDGLAKLRN